MSHRSARPGRATRAVLVALVAAVSTVAVSAPAAATEGVVYEPPTTAEVVDPFRAPATPYGPGNRGLTYDLAPGTPVHAVGPGTVVFAGAVAGTLHVTVRHPDGLRSSYSFLDGIDVRLGQVLARGTPVGTAGTGFHLGIRDGDAYLDPTTIFGRIEVQVRLVPHDEPVRPTPASVLAEHRALRALVIDWSRTGVLDGIAAGLDGTWDVVLGAGGHAVGELWEAALVLDQLVRDLSPTRLATDVVLTLWARHRQACTPEADVRDLFDDAAVAPVDLGADLAAGDADRVAVLVGGLGSSATNAAIDDVDLAALGYTPGDAIRFSYRGGRIPAAPDETLADDLAGLAATDYVAADTNGDIEDRGRALADLVEAAARARPGARIDLYAHSLGGLVTRVALLELADRPGGLETLGQVVTIGTPHDGADLATLAAAAGPLAHATADVVAAVAQLGVDADGVAVTQLAEHSDFMAMLGAEGVPAGVDFRTVGARGDLIVTADKSSVPGYPSTIIDLHGVTAHDGLPGAAETTEALALGLAGMDPACERFVDAVLDTIVPVTYAATTDALSLATLLGPLGPAPLVPGG